MGPKMPPAGAAGACAACHFAVMRAGPGLGRCHARCAATAALLPPQCLMRPCRSVRLRVAIRLCSAVITGAGATGPQRRSEAADGGLGVPTASACRMMIFISYINMQLSCVTLNNVNPLP